MLGEHALAALGVKMRWFGRIGNAIRLLHTRRAARHARNDDSYDALRPLVQKSQNIVRRYMAFDD